MNSRYQRGPPRYLSRGRGGRVVWDNWRPSIPYLPISWGGGGFDREDLSQDSYHSLNRTWQGDGETFHTLSSGESYRSLLSVSSEGEDSVSDPGDRLLELLGEAEVFRDSLESLRGFPRSSQRSGIIPTRVPRTSGRRESCQRTRFQSSQVPEELQGGILERENCTNQNTEYPVLPGGSLQSEGCISST